ncbi:GntR family transcriptional regulator [Streptomyces sp. NPDC090106]|uniref:GntR family transcriptional regulator n=1 Tax=Streptomyces sp. NPDC090106 TaxID=3365946 RepID=UPI003817593F
MLQVSGDPLEVGPPSDAPRDDSPGAPLTTDPAVGLLRGTLLTGGHRPGDRVPQAPLALRLGLSRRGVRTALHTLAEEGMLDLLPGGATAIPAVTAKDVLDLYALRASPGALLMRRVAMLGRDNLAPASAALAKVRAAARADAHRRIREVDLRYQDALLSADGNEAARLWRVKIERCVRYMVAQLPEDDAAPYLWTTLAGRPRIRPGGRPRGSAH